ncbi:MAG: hypothetical protein RL308_1585 [Bacteroidota bacterium]|jgi:hypothetical protein
MNPLRLIQKETKFLQLKYCFLIGNLQINVIKKLFLHF